MQSSVVLIPQSDRLGIPHGGECEILPSGGVSGQPLTVMEWLVLHDGVGSHAWWWSKRSHIMFSCVILLDGLCY